MPVGRVMTDPFSRCFSLGHKNLLLVSRTPLPRKKVGTIRREFVSLFYLFVATVKKKKKKSCVKSPTGHKSVLWAGCRDL